MGILINKWQFSLRQLLGLMFWFSLLFIIVGRPIKWLTDNELWDEVLNGFLTVIKPELWLICIDISPANISKYYGDAWLAAGIGIVIGGMAWYILHLVVFFKLADFFFKGK
jgi:hypothetical protein